MMYPTLPRSAFSLVELSIVLVILGLLTGGILAGQSLIRASELRSITTDHGRYMTAVQTFRDKYFALPGDITNATSFWGTDPNGCPTNTVKTPRTQTCNGNGDGRIGQVVFDGSGYMTFPTNNEYFRFWQQLAAAGLIEGQFSGVSEIGAMAQSNPNHNIPRGRAGLKGVTFGTIMGTTAVYIGTAPGGPGPELLAMDYGNALIMGASYGNNIVALGGGMTNLGGILPDEMWNIDTKMDDGRPFIGRLRTNIGFGCEEQIYAANPGQSEYNLGDYTGASCTLIFANAF